MNAMAKRTSKKSAKVATKAAAKRVDARAKPRKTAPKSQPRKVAKPTLLAGGNPQIAKADGDAPVQAYIAAMPDWKRDVGRRLDALIVRTVPGVHKAVKWNSPFYGLEGEGWFLSFHCFTKYVKVAFFRGTSLRPLPPGESKSKDTRYLDINEGPTRRGAVRRVGEASEPFARRTNVSGTSRGACVSGRLAIDQRVSACGDRACDHLLGRADNPLVCPNRNHGVHLRWRNVPEFSLVAPDENEIPRDGSEHVRRRVSQATWRSIHITIRCPSNSTIGHHKKLAIGRA